MNDIVKRVRIEANAGRVWDTLADFGNVSPWGPTVKDSYLVGKVKHGIGLRRVIEYTSNKETEEVAVDWQERKGFTVEYLHGGGAIKSFRQVWSLDGNKDEAIVKVHLTFDTAWGAIGTLVKRVALKKHFSRELTLALAGLKYYVETGEKVGNKTALPIKSVEFRK